jgi:spore coat protein U-like protein
VCALLVLAWARPARAASCSFVAVSGVSFGSYDVFDVSATDSAGSVSYTCSGGATVTMSLSIGSAPSYSPRQMLRMGGGGILDYNLYLDAGRSTIWGDGTSMTGQYGPNMPADGATVVVPIFGRVPAAQDATIGVYTDTITVTINF